MAGMLHGLGIARNAQANPQNLLRSLQQISGDNTDKILLCGICSDCHSVHSSEGDAVPVGHVHFFGFDGQKQLADFTSKYFSNLHITHAAVSNASGKVTFCSAISTENRFGEEVSSIVPTPSDCHNASNGVNFIPLDLKFQLTIFCHLRGSIAWWWISW